MQPKHDLESQMTKVIGLSDVHCEFIDRPSSTSRFHGTCAPLSIVDWSCLGLDPKTKRDTKTISHATSSTTASTISRATSRFKHSESIYSADLANNISRVEQAHVEVREEVDFPEGTSTVVMPYRTNFLAKILTVLAVPLGLLYLLYLWRHLQEELPVCSRIFFFVELWCVCTVVANRLALWHRQRRYACRLDRLQPPMPASDWPKVHICFTHYAEPIVESEKPLEYALKQQYPADRLVVTILDDGYYKKVNDEHVITHGGEEMESLISCMLAQLSNTSEVTVTRRTICSNERPEVAPDGSTIVEFFAPSLPLVRLVGRKKGCNSFAKTGNLENGLWNVMEEDVSFMVVMDTDMVAAPDMLQLLLSPMLEYRDQVWRANWRTAFVSSPQTFANIDANYGSTDPMNQGNKNYFRILPPALDSMGLVHFWGTNCAFFVPALKHSNGFMYGCITEDTVTGAALHRLGWESAFLGTPGVTLASGLCRETVSETFDQRKRWTQGNIQQLLTEFNPPYILHETFRNPPYRSAYYKLIQELKAADYLGEALPISLNDSGAKHRSSLRRSYLHFFQREIAYFPIQYTVLMNMMPIVYYAISLSIVLTIKLPFVMDWRPVKKPWDIFDRFYIMIGYWVVSSLASFFQSTYILSDSSNAANPLWRAHQEFWGFSWIRMVGIFQGTWSAMTGRQPKWNAFGMTGGLNFFLELPNAMAFIVMLTSMSVTAARFMVREQEENVFEVVGALMIGFWVLLLLWPVTSCIFADFIGIPYYWMSNFENTLFASLMMVSVASSWAIIDAVSHFGSSGLH